jgi:hypothetical protein
MVAPIRRDQEGAIKASAGSDPGDKMPYKPTQEIQPSRHRHQNRDTGPDQQDVPANRPLVNPGVHTNTIKPVVDPMAAVMARLNFSQLFCAIATRPAY